MDDTAQNTSVPASTQPVSQPDPSPVPADPVQQPVASVPQPQSSSKRPERAPGTSVLPPPREAPPVDDAEAVSAASSDDSIAQPDQIPDAADVQKEAAPDIPVQEAHPAVEVAPQLQEAGVEQGKDADRSQLPEEQLAKPDEQAQQPDTQAAASGISLASTPMQLEQVKKTSGIRDAIKWFAVSLIRQLKRMQMKPEDQKKTW